ncbi:hypothetical protein [Streptomyces sp. SID3915]|uniref:hypothetical protein n=1 Tax=Streptomyces sp. SID3915 TaxID=2690263 RepID=UPI00136C1D80|nr:hypothetical protein [Streptomyces sp. SID3915]MYX73114.1 hypothetical protein [Streptomyces sp. SID3915]
MRKKTERPPKVTPLAENARIPRSVGLRLRWLKRRRRTGVLFHCTRRTTYRSATWKWSIVSVELGGRTLCSLDDTHVRHSRFTGVPPGTHVLGFRVIRGRRSRGTYFEQKVDLAAGDVFLALCEPAQPDVFYRKSPSEDTWRYRLIRSDTALGPLP